MRKVTEYTVYLGGEEGKKEKSSFASAGYEWLDSIIIALACLLVVFTFFFRVAGVDGKSMYPTLNHGDWLAISSENYTARRGDIIVITEPNGVNRPIIKRIIGIAGDEIDIDFMNHTVSVNGKELDEPYINEPTGRYFDVEFPVTVPEGHVFVMGDNRNDSLDSRSSMVGFVDERYILGRAFFRFMPVGDRKIDHARWETDLIG